MVDATILGPAYWANKYGITSRDQFFDETNVAFMTGNGFFESLNPARVLQGLAYLSPTSIEGIYADQYLAGRPSTGDGAAVAGTMLQISGQAVNENQKGTSMTLVIPQCFQVTLQAVSGGQVVDHVIGVQNAAGSAAGAAGAVKTAWEITAGPLKSLTNLLAMTNYHAVDIGSTMGTIADVSSTAVGGNTTNPAISTLGACALIAWNGSSRSRSTRGRLYWGPLAEADINSDGRTIATASVSNLNTAFTNFRNSLNAAGYPLVVLSRKTLTAFPVTSHAVEAVVATQRRRIRG